ncbi:hypothetical protein BI364_02505 [Acidihalobacter yilgarnensis]|uniref:diguanylate cyclase n=1 Tax=Acidihalobacter yilgarnensis TaxID=2819280 RepID=A0A1D8IKM2_9GAMM|nr:sensor domain-containing diguanylate cyclase [Acidihalobacter yilgarnensis]AOU97023.1 hypothetical protein BI364_02505 [Acidihalobacter yilgarnensis]
MNAHPPRGSGGTSQAWLLDLHQLVVAHFEDMDAFAEACLEAGRRLLELETGIISHIDGDDYRIVYLQSPLPDIRPGGCFSLHETSCEAVVRERRTLCHTDASDPPQLSLSHPVYRGKAPLTTYISTPVTVDGVLYGTLNFSDSRPRQRPFDADQIMLVELMAGLIGRFIERNVRDRKRDELARHLVERQSMLDMSFNHAIIGKAIVDVANSHILDVNPTLCRMLGYPREALIDSTFERITHPDDRGLTAPEIRKLVRGKHDAFEMEKRYLHQDGHIVEAYVGITVIRDADGQPRYLSGELLDITARKTSETALREAYRDLAHLSITDALTGLHNRRSLDEVLNKETARARRSHIPLSLILLDIDHFKRYNDAFGHPAGDQALRQSARLITESIRTTDLAARYGGEEFAIVLPDTPGDHAAVLAERCRRAFLDEPWDHHDSPLTASFGVATLTDAMTDAHALLQRTDEALYDAKAQGRNRVIVAG